MKQRKEPVTNVVLTVPYTMHRALKMYCAQHGLKVGHTISEWVMSKMEEIRKEEENSIINS